MATKLEKCPKCKSWETDKEELSYGYQAYLEHGSNWQGKEKFFCGDCGHRWGYGIDESGEDIDPDTLERDTDE